MPSLDLHRKVALVTGINNPAGIGAAIARALTGAGASVLGTYTRIPAPAAETTMPGEIFYRAHGARVAQPHR